MTDNVVEFDEAEFKRMYPKITVTNEQLEMFFYEAEMLLNNTDKSCVKDLRKRKYLLYLIVAHLATLQANVDAGNMLVGRISSASEDVVSVSSEYGTLSNSEKWWVQTPYGAKYWQLIAQYRLMMLVATNFPMPVNRGRGR